MMNCVYPKIEPSLQSLMDALNGISGVQSGRAYPGHFASSVGPFVEFTASVDAAAQVATLLRAAWGEGALNYWWEIEGSFDAGGQLGFALRSPRLDRNRGIWFRFQDFVLNRQRIIRDLKALADKINNSGESISSLRKALVDQIEREGEGNKNQQPPLKCLLAEGIARVATGAFHGVRGNFSAANLAFLQFRHSDAFPLSVRFETKRIARSLIAVMFLSATLAACGTGRREIQQDGTGTDEMLKSPCACLPVPYEAPGFKWVS